MLAVAELAPHVGLQTACRAFALNRGCQQAPNIDQVQASNIDQGVRVRNAS